MEPQLLPPPELNFHELGPQIDPEVTEKEPDYQCGICSKHFLLRSELILHAKEDHNHQNRQSKNSYQSSKTKFKDDPGEPLELFGSQTRENLEDADTKLIPNAASTSTKYSHLCPTCYEVFDYRIQLNCHMKIHKNSPEISPGNFERDIKPTVPKFGTTEDLKLFPAKINATSRTKSSSKKSETRTYFCSNPNCNFKTRWAGSLHNHKKTCSPKSPETIPNNSAAILESPKINSTEKPASSIKKKRPSLKNSEKFYLCPNLNCDFKTRWPASLNTHKKSCSHESPAPNSHNNSVIKEAPEIISKKSRSSTVKKGPSSLKNSEIFYPCPNLSCDFKTRWPSSLRYHKNHCFPNSPQDSAHNSDLQDPPEIIPESLILSTRRIPPIPQVPEDPKANPPNNSVPEELPENIAKKPTSSKIKKKVSYKYSEKLFSCPNAGCNFKSRWPASRYQHKKRCSLKNLPKPNSSINSVSKEPSQVAKNSQRSIVKKRRGLKYSEKLYLCRNLSCKFKTRWPSSIRYHKEHCSPKSPTDSAHNSALKEPQMKMPPTPHSPINSVRKEALKIISKKSKASIVKKRRGLKFSEKLYKCPNLSCAFKTRWLNSLRYHKSHCSPKADSPSNSAPKEASEFPPSPILYRNRSLKYSDKFYKCLNSSCKFKTRWPSSLRYHQKHCSPKSPTDSAQNSAAEEPPEIITKKPRSSTKRKRVSYKNSEKFYLCPNSSCNFKTRWPSSLYNHRKIACSASPTAQSPNSAKEFQNVSKKSSSLSSKQISWKSLRVYSCPNFACNFKTRWGSSLWQHKQRCSKKRPNSPLKSLKRSGKLIDQKSSELIKKSSKFVPKKSQKPIIKIEDSEPQLVRNSSNKLVCSICGFCPTSIHNFEQHKPMHLNYKPFACGYPGCGFESRWEGNLRAHIWRRGHQSDPEPERNLECSSIVPSSSKNSDPIKKSKKQKVKSSRWTKREEIDAESSSLVLEESDSRIGDSSTHIEESCIEESSAHIGDLPKLDANTMAPQSDIELPPKLGSPQRAPSSETNELSCRIRACAYESQSPSDLRTHYHNMHPTLPLPSICHTSRLRNRSKTASPTRYSDSPARSEDLEIMEPSPNSSKKQSAKMLKQLFSCPMANCSFTTRWQIDIPKHFDRVHSSPGKSSFRSNKLFEGQQVQVFKQERFDVEEPALDSNFVDEESQTATAQCELNPKIQSQNEKSPSPPKLYRESAQEFPPAEFKSSEVKQKVKKSTKIAVRSSTRKVKAKSPPKQFKPAESRRFQDFSQVITDHSEPKGSNNRYKCPKCNYRQVTRWHIKRHMVTHGDDRPYPCPGCAMTFRDMAHLRIHQRKFPRCDLAQRRINVDEPNQPQKRNPAHVKTAAAQAPAKTLAQEKAERAPPKGGKNGCVFCSYLSKLSKFLQKHMRRCPGCHKAVELGDVQRDKKISNGGGKNGGAFACALCEFIGDSEVSASEHAREHKTVLVSLNREL